MTDEEKRGPGLSAEVAQAKETPKSKIAGAERIIKKFEEQRALYESEGWDKVSAERYALEDAFESLDALVSSAASETQKALESASKLATEILNHVGVASSQEEILAPLKIKTLKLGERLRTAGKLAATKLESLRLQEEMKSTTFEGISEYPPGFSEADKEIWPQKPEGAKTISLSEKIDSIKIEGLEGSEFIYRDASMETLQGVIREIEMSLIGLKAGKRLEQQKALLELANLVMEEKGFNEAKDFYEKHEDLSLFALEKKKASLEKDVQKVETKLNNIGRYDEVGDKLRVQLRRKKSELLAVNTLLNDEELTQRRFEVEKEKPAAEAVVEVVSPPTATLDTSTPGPAAVDAATVSTTSEPGGETLQDGGRVSRQEEYQKKETMDLANEFGLLQIKESKGILTEEERQKLEIIKQILTERARAKKVGEAADKPEGGGEDWSVHRDDEVDEEAAQKELEHVVAEKVVEYAGFSLSEIIAKYFYFNKQEQQAFDSLGDAYYNSDQARELWVCREALDKVQDKILDEKSRAFIDSCKDWEIPVLESEVRFNARHLKHLEQKRERMNDSYKIIENTVQVLETESRLKALNTVLRSKKLGQPIDFDNLEPPYREPIDYGVPQAVASTEASATPDDDDTEAGQEEFERAVAEKMVSFAESSLFGIIYMRLDLDAQTQKRVQDIGPGFYDSPEGYQALVLDAALKRLLDQKEEEKNRSDIEEYKDRDVSELESFVVYYGEELTGLEEKQIEADKPDDLAWNLSRSKELESRLAALNTILRSKKLGEPIDFDNLEPPYKEPADYGATQATASAEAAKAEPLEIKKDNPSKVEEEVKGPRDGWEGKTLAQIIQERNNRGKAPLGDFHPGREVQIGLLAQQEVDRIRKDLAEGKGGEERLEEYKQMLTWIPPEARPTEEDVKIEIAFLGAKNDAERRRLWRAAETNKINKMLKIAEAYGVTSADELATNFKTGDSLEIAFDQDGRKEWKVVFLTGPGEQTWGRKAILQHEENGRVELLARDIYEIDDFFERQKAPVKEKKKKGRKKRDEEEAV